MEQTNIIEEAEYNFAINSTEDSDELDDSNNQNPTKKEIRVGEGQTIAALGIGTVQIELLNTNGEVKKVNLNDCYYIPEMLASIVSLGRMLSGGAEVEHRQKASMLKTKKDKFAVKRKGNFFILQEYLPECHAIDDDPIKWHQRLAHPGKNRQLQLTGTEITQCETCIKHKLKKSPFKKGRTRATKYLQLIHVDLQGPIAPTSSTGKRYLFM
eukprot:TRINITY_DN1496_c0_g1_i5.p1 TRINITY_DN1496_c0_g1~~TRINITY_DN1496_c0_g1_i5.p1  ORF type:complete len:212 (+),score=15.51 TRINITY_DN1496_c0_g1_i5:299-934(+)